jgi:hypothetical protein
MNRIAAIVTLSLLLIGVVACQVSMAYKSSMIESGILVKP